MSLGISVKMATHSANKQDTYKAKTDNDSNIEFTEGERSFLNLVVEIVMKNDEGIEENIPERELNQQ